MCFYISYIISLQIFISCILLLVVLNKYINTCFTLFYCVILTSIHTCCLFRHRLEPFLSHQFISIFEYCIRLNYNILLYTYICTFSLCHCLPLSVWFQNDKPMVDIKKGIFFYVLLLAALHVFCAYSVPPFEGLAQRWMSVINLGWVQPCFAYFGLWLNSFFFFCTLPSLRMNAWLEWWII